MTAVVAAAVHDIVDAKYEKEWTVTRAELASELSTNLGMTEADLVMHIIHNMSWGDERAGKNIPLSDPEQENLRRLVQYADWLTSLGNAGFVKAYWYSRNQFKADHDTAVQHVISLFHSRLSLYKEMMVHIPAAVPLVEELHAQMEQSLSVVCIEKLVKD